MEQLNIENKNIQNIREYFELLRPLAIVFARYGVYGLRIDIRINGLPEI